MRHRPHNLYAAAVGLLVLAPGLRAADTPAPAPPAPQAIAVAPAVAAGPFQIPPTDDGLPGAGPIRRNGWFQAIWTERRSAWASQVQQDQGALVFLGDSITQGWGEVGGSFPGVKTANRGISGDTTRGVLIRLHEDVIALNPRGVVLLIGTNDLEEKAEPEVIAGNVKLIVAALHDSNPTMPVVLCEVFPSSLAKARPVEKIRRINALYLNAVADQPQVTVLDTWSLFANVHGDAKEDELPDLLHPDVFGYAKWAAALRPVLETLGLVPSWAENFSPEPGFVSLFDGHDLAGWGYIGRPSLYGKASSDEDNRFVVRNGRLIATISHKGQDVKKLWTTKVFPRDFVLKLEFRASPNAASGIFVRDTLLPCGDYMIAGPFATLPHYRALDWNEVVVTVRGGLAHCTCDGDVLVDAMPVATTGAIGLYSERGQVEYRRIRAQEAMR